VIAVTSKSRKLHQPPFFLTHPENTPNVSERETSYEHETKGKEDKRKRGRPFEGNLSLSKNIQTLHYSLSNLSIGEESQGTPCAFSFAGSDDPDLPETAPQL